MTSGRRKSSACEYFSDCRTALLFIDVTHQLTSQTLTFLGKETPESRDPVGVLTCYEERIFLRDSYMHRHLWRLPATFQRDPFPVGSPHHFEHTHPLFIASQLPEPTSYEDLKLSSQVLHSSTYFPHLLAFDRSARLPGKHPELIWLVTFRPTDLSSLPLNHLLTHCSQPSISKTLRVIWEVHRQLFQQANYFSAAWTVVW